MDSPNNSSAGIKEAGSDTTLLMEVKVTVPAEAESVRSLCTVVRSATECFHGSEMGNWIELVVAEAGNNISRYGYPDIEHGDIMVKLMISARDIRLVISDNGVCYDPTAQVGNQDWDLPEDADASLGFGISIIESVMDEVTHEYVDGGNRLAMKKAITS